MISDNLCLYNAQEDIALRLVSRKHKIVSIESQLHDNTQSCVAGKQSRAGLVVQGIMR